MASLECYLCGKSIKGPEGAIHPVDGFGFRHLHCDPQDYVQQLPKESAGVATIDADGNYVGPDSRYQKAKSGDVELSPYGALVAAREAADLDRQRKAAAKGGNS